MRVILKKSWTNKSGKSYPIGRIMQFDRELSKDLIKNKIAELYDGRYPPDGKTKTDFFNPKNLK